MGITVHDLESSKGQGLNEEMLIYKVLSGRGLVIRRGRLWVVVELWPIFQ